MTSTMTEAELMSRVRRVAKLGGYLVYHTHDSRRSDKGFPDLVLCHKETGRVIFVELKSARGRIRPEQQQWINALSQGLHDVHVWRPRDWQSGVIQDALLAERRAA